MFLNGQIILKIPTNATSISKKGEEKDVTILIKKKRISCTYIGNKQVVNVNLDKDDDAKRYALDKEHNTYDF